MIKKHSGILFIVQVFIFCSVNICFGDVTFVHGKDSNIGSLIDTGFLDRKPLVIFSNDVDNIETLLDIFKSHHERVNFVFINSTLDDMVFQYSTINVIPSASKYFYIDHDGTFGFYPVSKQDMDLEFKIFIDGRESVGKISLTKGRHVIECNLKDRLLAVIDKDIQDKIALVFKQLILKSENSITYILDDYAQDFIVPSKCGENKMPGCSDKRTYNLKIILSPKAFLDNDGKKNEIAPAALNKDISSLLLLNIDDKDLVFKDFERNDYAYENNELLLTKRIPLDGALHNISQFDNPFYRIDRVILLPWATPEASAQLSTVNGPLVTFQEINPCKYSVKIENAVKPFWLVFSETFHKNWVLYREDNVKLGGVVRSYPELKVNEAEHKSDFIWQDVHYLVKQQLNIDHFKANGYANGWYIDPAKLKTGKNFVLTLYFWPQSLYYVGFGILVFCVILCLCIILKLHE